MRLRCPPSAPRVLSVSAVVAYGAVGAAVILSTSVAEAARIAAEELQSSRAALREQINVVATMNKAKARRR